MNPTSGSELARKIYLKLQRLGRQQKRPTDELFLRYVLERFLYRTARSAYAQNFVLKGGMLLEIYGVRRPTRDIDFLVRQVSMTASEVSTIVAQIAELKFKDAVTFDSKAMSVSDIRGDDAYGGFRIRMPAGLDRARVTLSLDISVGEVVTPAPKLVTYPTLVESDGFEILSYPIETILAEKIETIIARGAVNTRDRDFADVYLLLHLPTLNRDRLTQAVTATAKHRGTTLKLIREAVLDLPQRRQPNWARYLARSGLDASLPNKFSEVVEAIAAILDPIITR